VLTLVSSARNAGFSVQAAIVGNGILRSELERAAARLGIRNAVHFTGRVDAMGDVYSALDGLVLLSDTETTSRVVIEAMASSVPVIATAVGGVPELLGAGQAGYLTAPGDAAAALRALKQLLDQPGRFADAALARASEFYSIEVMGQRTTEFYQSVLASGEPEGRLSGTTSSPKASADEADPHANTTE
jgi:glycosyltransferase involved in cell wall biosynthesis